MVAFHFPPEGGSSGVLRTLKFSKFLPENGWIPHILTLKETFYPAQDKHLMGDIPKEAVVHRTFALDSGRHMAIKGRYLACLAVPDRYVSWLPFGMARGMKVVRKEAIDVLYSTSPTPTAHLIALTIKARTGLPWVADFRDPWIEEGQFPVPGTLRYRIESALERLVVRHADRILVTTPNLGREFESRYPDLARNKVRVIYNGYDEADFEGLEEAPRAERFEFIHAGLVTPEFRNPFPLLEEVASLIKEGKLPPDRIRFTFLGGGSYVTSAAFSGAVRELGLDGVVAVEGRIPHREALRRQAGAAVLLLLQASEDTRSLIPAKAFEYLRLGRPVLAMTLEGATADLLVGMDGCHVVDPSNRTSLRYALLSLYEEGVSSLKMTTASRPIAQYDRRNLTVELSRLFNELVETGRNSR